MNKLFIEDLIKKIETELQNLPFDDFKKNLRIVIISFFEKLDLVTKEEFDIQEKTLKHAQEKLYKMEKKISDLEEKISNEKSDEQNKSK